MKLNITLCAALVLLSACSSSPQRATEPTFTVEHDRITLQQKPPLAFHTAEAQAGASLPRPPIMARVTAVEALTSPSFAPLEGRVVESRVHLGERVKKGQKLVLIRTGELSSLERERRTAELIVNSKSAHVARLSALVEARAGSMSDLLLAQSEAEEAKVALKAAEARLASYQIQRADDTSYWVVATRDGTVIDLNAAPGLEVGPSRGLPVLVVASLDEVMVVGDVPQRLASELSPGMDALIHVSRTQNVPGRLESVAEVVDPERQTVPVRVRADNRERKLRPNAYVQLSFSSSSPGNALLLPAACVVRDGAQAVVFVEDKAGSFVRREVALGQEGRDMVEILSGVTLGERVVSSGALLLLNALDTRASS